MIRRLRRTAKSAKAKLALSLLGVLAAAFGISAATSAGHPTVAVPTITAKPANPTSETSATLAFSSGSGVTYLCSLDGAIAGACASPKSYTSLAVGSHTFQVRAKRPSGELSGMASHTWVIDRTPPPAPAITSRPASPSNDAKASLSFTDAEAGVAFSCALDGAPFSACSSPKSYAKLSDGSHTFRVQARDAAGNASAAVAYTWKIDSAEPPTPRLTQDPGSTTSSTTATFAFTDRETGVGFECGLDGERPSPCVSPHTYTGLDAGSHRFAVRAVDAAGNRSEPETFWWKITRPSSKDFTISGSASGLLYPGAPARPIPLTLTNPNSVAIFVTGLQVTVSASSSPGCGPATNLALTQSSASSTAPVRVPPNGSVTLPTQGVTAPTIRLLNLPVNQDACKHATFSLISTGSAHS